MSNVELPGDEPTGDVAFPFVLVEGEEKAGKTSAAILLARSQQIGHSFICELGESKADEYKRLAPGRYRILRHNGTYWQIMKQLELAVAAPRVDNKPNLIIFDTATALWDMEKSRVDQRARRAAMAKAAKYNKTFDPDQEIKAPFNLWSDAKTRWYRIINLLRQSDCIVVVIARGKDAMKMGDDGKPVEGESEWKVQTEGNLKFEVDAWVRMMRPHTATLVGAGSWNVEINDDAGIPLPDGNPKTDRSYAGPLEHLVFEVLGVGEQFVSRQASVNASVGISVSAAKNGLVERFRRSCDEERATQEAATVWRKAGYGNLNKDAELTDEQWSKLMVFVAERVSEIMSAQEAPVLAVDNTPDEQAPPATMAPEPESEAVAELAVDPPDRQPEPPTTPPVEKPEEPEREAAVTRVNMGSDFSRLASEPGLQEQAMKWLRDNYGCAPMNVDERDVTEVRAYLEELMPPPPPFTDEDISPELSARRKAPPAPPTPKVDPKRKSSAADLDRLRASFRDHGITGPERQRTVARITGRQVRDFANLKVGEIQKVVDTLDSMETTAPSLLGEAS